MDHQPVPDEQKDHRAYGRADEPRALIEPIPTDGLADESRNESAGDAYQGLFGPGESIRAIRPAMKPMMITHMMLDTAISRNEPFDTMTP